MNIDIDINIELISEMSCGTAVTIETAEEYNKQLTEVKLKYMLILRFVTMTSFIVNGIVLFMYSTGGFF